jgi:hypothetical protein
MDAEKNGHHPNEDLAKSGYKTGSEVQIFKSTLCIFSYTLKGKYRNLTIFFLFFFSPPHFWQLKAFTNHFIFN